MTRERDTKESRDRAAHAAAAAREARGSVQEAIGKLIGDDAATAKGAAEKRAGAEEGASAPAAPRPHSEQE